MMPKKQNEKLIIIDGDKATLCHKQKGKPQKEQFFDGLTKDKQITLKSLVKKIIQNRKEVFLKTPLLPSGTRYYQKSCNARTLSHEIIVVEESPRVRTILTRKGTFTLAFPYIIFIFDICDGWLGDNDGYNCIFYRNGPLASLSDSLFFTNLTHVHYNSGKICLHKDFGPPDSLKKQVEGAIEHFWNTDFDDLDYKNSRDTFFDISKSAFTNVAKKDNRLHSLEAWQNASRKNPGFILKVPWCKNNLTIKNIIGDLLDSDEYNNTQTPLEYDELVDIFHRTREEV